MSRRKAAPGRGEPAGCVLKARRAARGRVGVETDRSRAVLVGQPGSPTRLMVMPCECGRARGRTGLWPWQLQAESRGVCPCISAERIHWVKRSLVEEAVFDAVSLRSCARQHGHEAM
jgi:hypothetical protein